MLKIYCFIVKDLNFSKNNSENVHFVNDSLKFMRETSSFHCQKRTPFFNYIDKEYWCGI